jgi:hypothetical protein
MTHREFRDYARKVFGFPDRLATVGDGRRRPHHSLPTVLSALMHGLIFRERSLHAVEESARRGPLFSPDGIPQ